mmetsp:Transcript_33322/g.72052  ORF Transcript_33322/g.72052 Transcript_33322/m.72052 type:complete len:236 (-) Transcript_33322:249-956(-)
MKVSVAIPSCPSAPYHSTHPATAATPPLRPVASQTRPKFAAKAPTRHFGGVPRRGGPRGDAHTRAATFRGGLEAPPPGLPISPRSSRQQLQLHRWARWWWSSCWLRSWHSGRWRPRLPLSRLCRCNCHCHCRGNRRPRRRRQQSPGRCCRYGCRCEAAVAAAAAVAQSPRGPPTVPTSHRASRPTSWRLLAETWSKTREPATAANLNLDPCRCRRRRSGATAVSNPAREFAAFDG